jgi:hypothetical protein
MSGPPKEATHVGGSSTAAATTVSVPDNETLDLINSKGTPSQVQLIYQQSPSGVYTCDVWHPYGWHLFRIQSNSIDHLREGALNQLAQGGLIPKENTHD